MAKLKKVAALAVALAMTLSLGACGEKNRYVMEYDGEKINAGVYILNMYSEMSSQIAMMYYYQGITEDYFSQEVEGKSLSDYLSDKAYSATRDYAAVVTQFDSLGLSLTEDETKEISDQVSSMWDGYGELYESLGISKESAKLVYLAQKMDEKLFDYYYGAEGTEAVSDSDLESYVNENYLRYKVISIQKSTNEDETAAAEEDKESEALRDEYLAKAEGVDFAGFDEIITQYNDYLTEKAAAEADADSTTQDDLEELAGPTLEEQEEAPADESAASEDAPEESAASGEETAESSEEVPEEPNAGEEETPAPEESAAESAVEETAEEETGEVTESAADESVEETVGDDSTAEDGEVLLSGEDAGEEPDPYANEVMRDYSTLTEEDLEEDSGKLMTFIKGLETGKATAYEDDNTYYIVIKGDVTERSAEYVSENRDTLVHSVKDDDYRAKKDSWVEAISFTDNTDAIKRYTPKAIYDREEKYYDEHGAS